MANNVKITLDNISNPKKPSVRLFSLHIIAIKMHCALFAFFDIDANCAVSQCGKNLLTQIDVEDSESGTGFLHSLVLPGLGTSGWSSGFFVSVVIFWSGKSSWQMELCLVTHWVQTCTFFNFWYQCLNGARILIFLKYYVKSQIGVSGSGAFRNRGIRELGTEKTGSPEAERSGIYVGILETGKREV